MSVLPKTTSLTRLLAAFFACCALLQGLSMAEAEAKKGIRHIFVISRVEIPESAPAELESLVRQQLTKAIEAEPKLLAQIPSDAPPVDETQKGLQGNKPFRKYMKKRGLRPYKVIVQVTDYEATVEPNDKKPGNVVGTNIKLRMFGETIPEHVMAFTGDGSAQVLVEVGKKVRDRDRAYADSDAIELAVSDAIKTSLQKLETKKPKQKRRKKKSKK